VMDAAKESLLRNGEPVEVHRVQVQAAA
jgi:hypothetical protein